METEINYAIHPGKILLDNLKVLGITQKELAERTGLQRTVINEIIKGKRNINADVAVRLEKHFSMSARYWLNLQSLYDEVKARIDLNGMHYNKQQHISVAKKTEFSNRFTCFDYENGLLVG